MFRPFHFSPFAEDKGKGKKEKGKSTETEINL
jgi:hypothetical protein